MSAGVIISLAANKIYLARNGFMGPIDPQIGWGFSAQSIIDFTKNIAEKQSWIADIACLLQGPSSASITRTTNLVDHICKKRGYTDVEAKTLISKLLTGGLNHDQALMYDDLSCIKQLQPDVPDIIIEIVDLMPAGQSSIYSISDVKEESKNIKKITAKNFGMSRKIGVRNQKEKIIQQLDVV